MWNIPRQEKIIPNIEMIEQIVNKLNADFDSYDIYHHGSHSTEMFEFTYKIDCSKRERWEITFLDWVVASGGGGAWGADYEDCFEDDYITLTEDNKDKIYEMAYNGAIGRITDLLNILSYANIDKSHKENWINIINKGIAKVEEDNK